MHCTAMQEFIISYQEFITLDHACSMVLLYIRDLAKNNTLKPASQYLHVTWEVLVRYNQAQKCLQYDLKCFQKLLRIKKYNINIYFSGIFY